MGKSNKLLMISKEVRTSPIVVNFLKTIDNDYFVNGYRPEDIIDIRKTSDLK